MATATEGFRLPQIEAEQLALLERLSNACAVSGDEGEVRKIVLAEIRPYLDEVKVDALGNVLATKRGVGEKRMRVMLAAHMDEVGLMVTSDEGDGIFRFETVGGISASDLPGKVMWVGKDHIPGVTGIKPIHLTEADERKRPITADRLRLDVGSGVGKVKVGDRATFATRLIQQGLSLRGKALDDRLGVATLIEIIKHAPPQIDIQAAFTVQEEIGLRGARVAAFTFDPDLAIVLDSTPAYDLPAWEVDENVRYNTRLGGGGAIYVADSSTLSDPRLVRYLIKTAEAHAIQYQIRQPGGGGTDAGAIHKQLAGIPSVSVSVPGRYHHSPAAIVRQADWQNTYALVAAALFDITPQVLAGER
ncbi:MAG: M42 family metallopeptidase [Acidobacteriaceae bacterium]